jgi:hypothetical protein
MGESRHTPRVQLAVCQRVLILPEFVGETSS